jgi:hypothetical protein
MKNPDKSVPESIQREFYWVLNVIRERSPETEMAKIDFLIWSHNRGEPGYQGWELPHELTMSHRSLKKKLQTIMGIGELTEQNLDKKLAVVKKILARTYELIGHGRGLVHSDIAYSGESIPQSFYLGYPDRAGEMPTADILNFLVLSALSVAHFEMAMTSIRNQYESLKGTQEFHDRYSIAVQHIMDDQETYLRVPSSLSIFSEC